MALEDFDHLGEVHQAARQAVNFGKPPRRRFWALFPLRVVDYFHPTR
jgi:hypothetical protein